MEKYTKYPNSYPLIQNKPFTHHVDYGLSRGFITSPVEDFPYTCAPHVQQIRIVKRPRDSGIETPFDIIALLPGELEQPITMPGLNYGIPLETPVMYPGGKTTYPVTTCHGIVYN